MSNRPFLFIFLLLAGMFLSERIFAQRFLGGLSAGINLTQVDGDIFYGYSKVGFNVGPMVAVPFGKNRKWSASLELLYSQKGSRHKGSADSTNYSLRLDYAEVPVLIHFTDKKLISGGVGFSYGQLINYTETKNSFYDTLFKYQTGLSKRDISVIADVQIRIWSKLWVDLRYQYTMKSNRTVIVDNPVSYPRNPYTRYQYNNVVTLRFTWVFNQARIEKPPREQ